MPPSLSPEEMMAAQNGEVPSQTPSLPVAPTLSVGTEAVPTVLSPEQMMQAQGVQQPQNSLVSAGKWALKTFRGIEQPFVSLAATPVQLLAKAIGAQDPYAQGFPQLGGTVPIAPLTPQGLAQKAGQVAQVASMMLTPESAGMQGIAKLGLLGATGGAGSYLADTGLNATGKGIENSALQGAAFGAILGGLGNAARAISGSEKAMTGVTPAMENEISQVRPTTLGQYINAAKNSARDFHAETPDDILNEQLKHGAEILDKKVIPQAGRAVGEAKKAAGTAPIVAVSDTGQTATGANAVSILRDQINDKLETMTGHQFSSYASGEQGGLSIANYPEGASTKGITASEGSVVPLPNRPGIAPLSNSEQKSLEDLARQLDVLEENPTVQTASDIVGGLDKKIDWARIQQYGAKSSPVDAILQQARGMINGLIRPAAPELAAANDVYGPLAQVKEALAASAGKNLQNIDLLARRSIYAGQSGKAQSVLDMLYNAVKPYLPPGEESYTAKAIVARFAKDNFGGLISQTGFKQGMTTGDVSGIASGYTSRVVGAALRAAKRTLAPNPEQYAMSIARHEPYSFVPLVHHIDEFIESQSNSPVMQSFKDALKAVGVSSSHVGQSAKDLWRMMIFENLVNSSASQNLNAGGTPFLTPPTPQSQAVNTQLITPSRSIATSPPTKTLSLSTGPGMRQQQSTTGGLNMNTPSRTLSLGGTS